MSYSGPPGAPGSHSSLPPRPPSKPSAGFKPAFSAAPTTYSTPPAAYGAPVTSSYSRPSNYGAAAPPSYGAPPATTSYSSYPSAPPSLGAARAGYTQAPASYNAYPAQTVPGQPPSYYGASSAGSYSTPPQIRNPFPAPAPAAAAGSGAAIGPQYDPEEAAQIAQWQSAYMPKDASAAEPVPPTGKGASRFGPGTYGPSGANSVTGADASKSGVATPTTTDAATPATAAGEKKKTVIREGGGKKWADDSLLEWDPSHLRLFVGNLAGETTDESLLKAFSRWSSVQKAKVIRDKRTTKSKGYGFVSFSDPDDFFQAAKEMNGKYIQSHPVVVHKAKTEIKPQVVREDKGRHNKGKNWKDKKNKQEGHASGSGMGSKDGTASPFEPHLGPQSGGITKPGQKTRGGLKILG